MVKLEAIHPSVTKEEIEEFLMGFPPLIFKQAMMQSGACCPLCRFTTGKTMDTTDLAAGFDFPDIVFFLEIKPKLGFYSKRHFQSQSHLRRNASRLIYYFRKLFTTDIEAFSGMGNRQIKFFQDVFP